MLKTMTADMGSMTPITGPLEISVSSSELPTNALLRRCAAAAINAGSRVTLRLPDRPGDRGSAHGGHIGHWGHCGHTDADGHCVGQTAVLAAGAAGAAGDGHL